MDPTLILPGSMPSITPDIWSSKPRVELSRVEPRPTQRFDFEWNPTVKKLCIKVQEGVRHEVNWVGLSTSRGPNSKEYQAETNPSVERDLVEAQVERDLAQVKALVESKADQVEAQVETPEATSIQAFIEVPLKAFVVDNPSLLGESSRSLSALVVDSHSRMDSTLEPSSPINAIQGLFLRNAFWD